MELFLLFKEYFPAWEKDILMFDEQMDGSIHVQMKDKTIYQFGRTEDGGIFLKTVRKSQ